jgi:prepilin-type N-terminal cleavage/methylation domain-containing protein
MSPTRSSGGRFSVRGPPICGRCINLNEGKYISRGECLINGEYAAGGPTMKRGFTLIELLVVIAIIVVT